MGWLASGLILLGHWMLGHKWRGAFICTLAGDLLWIWVAVERRSFDLVAICIVSACFQVHNFYKWGE